MYCTIQNAKCKTRRVHFAFHFAFCILHFAFRIHVLRELPPLLKLAGPVILAEIGWMVMGIVDTMMVGPLGPAAIGAAGLGSGVFTAIAIFGMGLMLGLDAYVSQTHGAGDE